MLIFRALFLKKLKTIFLNIFKWNSLYIFFVIKFTIKFCIRKWSPFLNIFDNEKLLKMAVKNGDLLYGFCREFYCELNDQKIYRVFHLKKWREMVFIFFEKRALKICISSRIGKKRIQKAFSLTFPLSTAKISSQKCFFITKIWFFKLCQ